MTRQNQYAITIQNSGIALTEPIYIEVSYRTGKLYTIDNSGKRTEFISTIETGEMLFKRMLDLQMIKLISYKEAKQLLESVTKPKQIVTYYKHVSEKENDWYVTYNHITDQTFIHRKNGTESYPECEEFSYWPLDRIKYFVTSDIWKEITKQEALKLVEKPKPVKTLKPTKSYYVYVGGHESEYHFFSYNHQTTELVMYNKDYTIFRSVDNKNVNKHIKNNINKGIWKEITRQEAINLLNI